MSGPRCAADILPADYADHWADSVIFCLSDENPDGDIRRPGPRQGGQGTRAQVRDRRIALHVLASVYGLTRHDSARRLGMTCGSATGALRQHLRYHTADHRFAPHAADEARQCDLWRDGQRSMLIEDVDEIMGWHDPWLPVKDEAVG